MSAPEFIVVKSGWGPEMYEVTRRTPQCVFFRRHPGSKREGRAAIDNVVFEGPQEAAQRLKDQLVSSRARWREEERRALERMKERDSKIIEAARAALASAKGGE